MTSLGRTLVRGSAWMIGFRLLDRSVGLISVLVLARVLTPADFGLVAMATAMIAFVELFGWLGLDVALIQRPGATREHFDSAWTMNVLIGASVALVLLACGWPLAWVYDHPRLLALAGFQGGRGSRRARRGLSRSRGPGCPAGDAPDRGARRGRPDGRRRPAGSAVVRGRAPDQPARLSRSRGRIFADGGLGGTGEQADQ